MNWFYAQKGRQLGPVSEPEFKRLVGLGEVVDTTLVWHAGMPAWQPYGAIKPAGEIPPTLDAVLCSVCQRRLPPDETINLLGQVVCGTCKPAVVQGMREGATVGVANVWRSGRTVVMNRGATLPNRCFKCGSASHGPSLKRRLYWHHPAIYLTIIASILIYALVAIIVRKRADVTVGLCEAHWTQRRIWLGIAWLGGLASIALMVWGVMNESAVGFWGLPLLLFAICAGNFGARITYASRIDGERVWLRGAGRAYLEALPEWSGR